MKKEKANHRYAEPYQPPFASGEFGGRSVQLQAPKSTFDGPDFSTHIYWYNTFFSPIRIFHKSGLLHIEIGDREATTSCSPSLGYRSFSLLLFFTNISPTMSLYNF